MAMEDADAKVLTISDLLRRPLPFAAASSLRPSSSRRDPPTPTTANHRQVPTVQHSKPKILTPIKHPVVLIGTVSLPLDDDGPSTSKCLNGNVCFLFSDEADTVCCDVLDFGFPMLGKKILVLAFNFIPFKLGERNNHCGGLLEIIKWSLLRAHGGLRPCSNEGVFPLVPSSLSSLKDDSKALSSICGVVESVGPISAIPCSSGTDINAGNPRKIRGFLAEFMICQCKLCKSKGQAKSVVDNASQNPEGHVYSKPLFVYFSGSASSWQPAIAKLIDSPLLLTELKKKLVYVGKEESQLMYVITNKSRLHLLRMHKTRSSHIKVGMEGEGKFGAYTGLVKSVYMHGMVVELDNEVWLLATDQQLRFPHSIRVGAVISVKNVHFVRTKFAGKKVLILGCCFKTSILVERFSPFATGCHITPEMQSLLGNLIASLTFSARLWVLLMVSSFRKKFGGILSEKEILGSKTKEGLLQLYVTSCLPSWALCSRHGAFTEMSRHTSSACGSDPDFGDLKLAVPLSSFIRHCEAIWSKITNGPGRVCQESHKKQGNFCHFCGGGCSQSLRRIISSEEIGIVLLGNIKLSPVSGRLQLVDATGSVDVLIPDLPSTWDTDSICEISKYNLVIEGIPQQADNIQQPHNEPFSCSSIFNCTKVVEETKMHLFLYFYSSSATFGSFSFKSFRDRTDEYDEFRGKFHMLRIVHKFPVLQKLHGNPKISENPTMFVEAAVLAWDLCLSGNDGSQPSSKEVTDPQNGSAVRYTSSFRHVSCNHKKQKTDQRSWIPCPGSFSKVGSVLDSSASTDFSKDNDGNGHVELDSHKVPCLVSVRSPSYSFRGTLYRDKETVKPVCSSTARVHKLLMEFKSADSLKYQSLQIGQYYIMKHQKENSCCCYRNSGYDDRDKVLINSRTRLWTLSIFSRNVILANDPSHDAPSKEFDISNNGVLPDYEIRNKIQSSAGHSLATFSDVSLYVAPDAGGMFDSDLIDWQRSLANPASTVQEVIAYSSSSGTSVSSQWSPQSTFGYPFPEGNLICVCGHVISICGGGSSDLHRGPDSAGDRDGLRNLNGDTRSISILVSLNNHTVEIFGHLRKHACPVGFGPGVDATFYRILKLGAQKRLMLTPISFIEVNSVKILKESHFLNHFNVHPALDASNEVSSGLISEFIQQSDFKVMRLRCRVIAVLVTVLQKNRKSDSAQSRLNSMSPLVNIPIAGFVVEDGSSSCVCWANEEQASTLLRLHEKLQGTALESRYWSLKGFGGSYDTSKPSDNYLERILRKHGKVTMKNYGSQSDTDPEFVISVGSDNALSCSEENLLEYVMLNASSGREWIIVGRLMGSTAVQQLEKQHSLEIDMQLDQSFRHMWAIEVNYSNPLMEARKTADDLLRDNCSG